MGLALRKLKVWRGQGHMSSCVCYAVSRGGIYLHRVLGEHHGEAWEPASHGPGGSRGGFREAVIPQGRTGAAQVRGGCRQ